MPMAKLYLLQGWSQGGWPTLYLGGGGGWNAYHKKVNESLKFKNNLRYAFYKQYHPQQKAALCK